jgi:hypothetical protein
MDFRSAGIGETRVNSAGNERANQTLGSVHSSMGSSFQVEQIRRERTELPRIGDQPRDSKAERRFRGVSLEQLLHLIARFNRPVLGSSESVVGGERPSVRNSMQRAATGCKK